MPFSRIGAPEDIGAESATTQTTTTDSYTAGFEYSFGGSWGIKGYYQAGETDVKAIQKGGIRLDRIFLAADVVTTLARATRLQCRRDHPGHRSIPCTRIVCH